MSTSHLQAYVYKNIYVALFFFFLKQLHKIEIYKNLSLEGSTTPFRHEHIQILQIRNKDWFSIYTISILNREQDQDSWVICWKDSYAQNGILTYWILCLMYCILTTMFFMLVGIIPTTYFKQQISSCCTQVAGYVCNFVQKCPDPPNSNHRLLTVWSNESKKRCLKPWLILLPFIFPHW